MQTDPIGYADQMNSYAYVGGDPVNLIDPLGLAGCSDMEGQGLTAKKCIDSSNFNEKLDSGDAVSTANIDQSATENMSSLKSTAEEKTATFTESDDGEVSFKKLETTVASDDGSKTGRATMSSDADAVGHSHSESDGELSPGPMDDSQPEKGRPMYIYNDKRIIVIEKSGGQYRVRVIKGRLGRGGLKRTKYMLNLYQARNRSL